jgi:hypothetical protein
VNRVEDSGLDSYVSREETAAGCCEHGYEHKDLHRSWKISLKAEILWASSKGLCFSQLGISLFVNHAVLMRLPPTLCYHTNIKHTVGFWYSSFSFVFFMSSLFIPLTTSYSFQDPVVEYQCVFFTYVRGIFFPLKVGWVYTQTWMPTYVSLLRIPQMIWVWRATVEWYWQGKTEELGEKPVPVPFCPQHIPHGLTRVRTRASLVTGRRLMTWAMARPVIITI